MQGLITCVLILGFISPCLCVKWNIGTKDAAAVYNVMNYGARGDGKSDDSQAFLNAWHHACGTQGATTLTIPSRNFMVTNLMLSGPCKATSIHIQLQGVIAAPPPGAWKDKSYWIKFMYVNKLTINGRGRIHGRGYNWWHCGNCQRPDAVFFHFCNNLIVSDVSFTNSPRAHIAINDCDGATFSNVLISSPFDSPNTDGFDISGSKNILIQDSNIRSGDDCIAINGGCFNINATKVTCGPGHGISVGSLGKSAQDTVEEVYVRNCIFKGTSNGARIKTFTGGSGYARKITFEQIHLFNVKNPIIIDQNYKGGYATNSAVQVSEVTYRGFNGTSASDVAINLDCGTSGCFNIVLNQIKITSSESGRKLYATCKNARGTATSTFPSVPCLGK